MRFLCFSVLYIITELQSVSCSDSQNVYDFCRNKYYSCHSKEYNMCRCDRLCRYYDDCCFDAHETFRDETALEETMIPSIGRIISFLGETTCEKTSSHKLTGTTSRGAFMVSSCPATWKGDKEVKHKCESNAIEDLSELIPVFDRSTNVTFKNRQCAWCHNRHHCIPWRLNITCGNLFYLIDAPLARSWNDYIMLKINSIHCNYKLFPSNHIDVRYCSYIYNYDLWNTMKEVNETSCNNRVFSPFLFSRTEVNVHVKQYRNKQCFIDEYGTLPLDTGLVSCEEIRDPRDHSGQTISDLIDISAIFRTPDNNSRCSDTEIYLSHQIGCHTLYCPADMEPVRGSCVLIKYQTKGIMLDLLFEANVDIRYYPFGELVGVVINRLNQKLHNISLSHKYGIGRQQSSIYRGYHVNTTEPCSLIQFRCTVREQKYRKATSDYTKLILTNLFEQYEQNLSSGVYVKHVDEVIKSDCKCKESLRNPSYIANQVPHDSSLPCPAVEVYPRDNYSDINDSNSYIANSTHYQQLFVLNGLRIEPKDVLLQFGSYFLCVDTFLSKYQEDSKHDTSMAYYRYVVNTICTSSSIISLIYTLVQYCCIPFLREGKSELLFILMLFLLIAQTAFMLLSHITLATDLCGWFGLLHHFVWIGSFSFMFLCSYRLNAEIRSLSVLSKSKRLSETVKYGISGLVFSILIVICTKIINLIVKPAENWYGGEICFISNVHVLLWAFILPTALIQIGNITLFVLIVNYIRTTAIANNSGTFKSLNFVLIKISSIMGFSWIIGIVAIFVQSEILLIIFENVSSLQGMFLTVSFLCNNRVYNFYRDICLKSTNPSTVQTRSSNSRF